MTIANETRRRFAQFRSVIASSLNNYAARNAAKSKGTACSLSLDPGNGFETI
jgi:hypothetical protein